jgi:hypothetical protein
MSALVVILATVALWFWVERVALFERFAVCTGCHRKRCPKTGFGFSRRRRFAYCPDCMPDLYKPPEGRSDG